MVECLEWQEAEGVIPGAFVEHNDVFQVRFVRAIERELGRAGRPDFETAR